MKVSIKEVVKDGNVAKLSYICNGIAFFNVDLEGSTYQFEVDSTTDEWKSTYLYPEYKAITLMRWIRKCIQSDKLVKVR